MWAATSRFLAAIASPHKTEVTVTVTVPGGAAVPLRVKGGSVSADSSANIRRKGSLELFGSAKEFDLISTPGAVFTATSGIRFGNDAELLPVFTGGIVDGSQALGNGSVSVSLADHGAWVAGARFLTPFAPVPSLTRKAVIAAVVATAKPGVLVNTTASDTGLVGSKVWDRDPWSCINDLCKDGLMEAFFLPDGSFLIRDQQTLTTSPVWTVSSGSGGTLKSAERKRPLDKLYNTVVVRPSASDGSQGWTQQVAQVSDVTHPRHPSKVGVVPYFWASPSILDAGTALAVGYRMLDRVMGTTETLSLGAVANPALDASDVIRVITPRINQQPAMIFQHFIDSLSLDLVTGDMSMATRSQVVTDDAGSN